MNERIKKLALQAGYQEDMFGIGHWDMPEFKKFAELLVREFEVVAKQQPHYYDAPSCGWRNPINYVCRTVKEHFGVKND